MNKIKRIFGAIWLLLGPVAAYYLINTALTEIDKKPGAETLIQWSVFVVVFLPIAAGFMMFGYYALRGEYDQKK